MKLQELKELMKVFEETGLYKMKLKTQNFSVELEKEATATTSVLQAPTAPLVQQVVQQEPEVKPQEEKSLPSGTQVKAPLVGVFYTAASPESKPFIEVGQKVKKGQVLCIVEAMKVMNQIESPCDGVVTVVLPQNGDMVEFDQTLMIIA